jgi:hypothetical protein
MPSGSQSAHGAARHASGRARGAAYPGREGQMVRNVPRLRQPLDWANLMHAHGAPSACVWLALQRATAIPDTPGVPHLLRAGDATQRSQRDRCTSTHAYCIRGHAAMGRMGQTCRLVSLSDASHCGRSSRIGALGPYVAYRAWAWAGHVQYGGALSLVTRRLLRGATHPCMNRCDETH